MKSLSAALRRKLEWIPLKAMRKDRQERYGSPTELAPDVRNYLSGSPSAEGPESMWYRVRKHAARLWKEYVGIILMIVGMNYRDWWSSVEARSERAEHDRRYEVVAGLTPEAVEAEDWSLALHLMEALPDGFRFATSRSPSVGNRLVRFGLTALPADSPARDLERLLWLAEWAVDDSSRQDPAVLATLARVHWEFGDRPKAFEIQREAIAVHAAGSGEPVTPEAKALAAGLAATLASYESLPAGAALPKESEALTSP